MKRWLAALLTILIAFTSIPMIPHLQANAEINEETFRLIEHFRITVDGQVYETPAYISSIDGEPYFRPEVIRRILGSNPTATKSINGMAYTSLKAACTEFMLSSYELDKLLNAAYIWINSNEAYSDNKRNAYYDLGTPTDTVITYEEFLQLMDRAVEAADERKLSQWKTKFPELRDCEEQVTRLEGMTGLLYLAAFLSTDYTEFNMGWEALDSTMTGSDADEFWQHFYTVPEDYGEYFENTSPYSLGGFTGSPYINTWDTHGVAYRYSFARRSLLNGRTLFDYDEASNSMRQASFMTDKEAMNALSRLLDSKEPPINIIPITNNAALQYDRTIITDSLLNKSQSLPVVDGDHIPKWNGFVLPDGSYERTTIDVPEMKIMMKRVANWGFNNVRYMLTYQTLFDEGVTEVNETNLKKLDAIVATAINYNLHLNIVTFSMPGRWTKFDFTSYTTEASLDLFTNEERQEEAGKVWALLAERYKDIPSATLSFSPLWETQNQSLSSGLYVPPYTVDNIADVYSSLVNTIRQHDPDRFILYEPTACNDEIQAIQESTTIRNTIEPKEDVLMVANFCSCPYVYAEMTATEGEHIDHNNHSMFKPEYPVKIYAAQYHINKDAPLKLSGASEGSLNGKLVKGTTIDLYLKQVSGNGTFTITGDGTILHSEDLTTTSYTVESPLSMYYLYAKSDKHISVTLPEDVADLQIGYSGDWFEWSGIDVTLPSEYAVDRWWFMSGYDANLAGEQRKSPELRPTSTIMISPNSYDNGRELIIHPDITYSNSTEYIRAQANKDTIDAWGSAYKEFSPSLMVRLENAAFCIGTQYESALQYYEDFLTMCDKYGFSWYSNEYILMCSSGKKDLYAGGDPEAYKDDYLLVDMLKVFQKHATAPTIIKTSTKTDDIAACTISVSSAMYNNRELGAVPTVTIYNGIIKLIQDTDYTLSYDNNKAVGENTAKVTIKGKGCYGGTIIKNYTITPKPIASCTITLSETGYTYDGEEHEPDIEVRDGNIVLVEGTDYRRGNEDSTYAGKAKAEVIGIGNYSGEITKEYTIAPRSITKSIATLSTTSYTYTGSAKCPSVVVKDGSKILSKGVDYTYQYSNNVNAGTAKVTITGKGNYGGVIVKYFSIKPKSNSKCHVALSTSTYTYNGKSKSPSVTVKDGSKVLVKGTDYTYKYSNNTKVGTATVSITGKGNYTGTIKKTYSIKLGTPKLKVTAGKKKATITWGKITGASGYNLYMATSKNGSYKLISSKNVVKVTKKSLKSNRRYYFKIKTYMKVGSKKVYSSYSTVVSTKIK